MQIDAIYRIIHGNYRQLFSRKLQRKAGAALLRYHTQCAVVHVHNLLRQCKADARALWLGGEEGDENLFLHFGQYAWPIVRDVQLVVA